MDAEHEHVDLENVIVVGVDGSEYGSAAADWAADSAHRRGAELRLVCAWTLPIETMSGMDVPPQSIYDSQRLWAEGVLREESTRVGHRHPDLLTSTVLSREFPMIALRDVSEHALMTVVGAQGSGAMAGLLMGSVAQQLVTHGAGPVVVVHQRGSSAQGGPVVVGLDGSPESDDALAFAFEEASFRAVPLWVIRVWDGKPGENPLLPYLTVQNIGEVERGQTRDLAEQVTGWKEKYPDVTVQHRVLQGKPASALLSFCASREELPVPPVLVVVGSRGRGGFLGMLLGSTSQTLATHAADPLCVVHRYQH